jgi:hypothetical protein
MNGIPRICLSRARRAGVLLANGVATRASLATTQSEPPGWNQHPRLRRLFSSPPTALYREDIMKYVRRILAALATLAGALLAFTASSPAAFAIRVPPPGETSGPLPIPPPVHTVIVGGMPGWQITLIAAGAALVTAALAVLLDHTRTARKTHATTA